MLKFLKTILYFFSIILSLTGCKENPESLQKIIVGTSIDYPPFAFYRQGKPAGFEIELISKILSNLNFDFEVQDLPFSSIIAALRSNRIDLSISAITATPERKKNVDFSIPYVRSYTVLMVGKNSKINDLGDLKDCVVGVQAGTTYEILAKKIAKDQNFKVHALGKIPELLQEYQSGRIDALIVGNVEAKTFLEINSDFRVIAIEATDVEFAIATPQNSLLLEKINQEILKLKSEGFIDNLSKKYF
jgi:arginine/lysine/histidine transporter system substrate-binding protein